MKDYFWGRVSPLGEDECWLWRGGTTRGYGVFTVATKHVYAHRVSWELHKGPIENGLDVLHRCDVPLCVNPNHLFLGTQTDNVNDMWAKGRANPPVGERNRHAKLTAEQVYEIRDSSKSLRELALQYGVTMSMLSSIKRRASWKCLPERTSNTNEMKVA